MQDDFLIQLFTQLKTRKTADPSQSYTAKLFAGGVPLCARKLGEEATEILIAALCEDDAALAQEMADMLYHMQALLIARNMDWADVIEVLRAREGVSGLAEKAARQK